MCWGISEHYESPSVWLDTVSPVDGISNKQKLSEEIGQLQYCLHRLTKELNLDQVTIQDC